MTALETLGELASVFSKAGIRFRVGGSIASSVWGDPRQTNDIDVAVLSTTLDEAKLRAALPEQYFISPDEIRAALQEAGEYPAFQILYMDEAFKFDVFIVHPDEYTLVEFARVRQIQIMPGLVVPLASPEDIVLHKLRWFVAGGKISDRQWNDLVRVIETQANSLDRDYLARWASHFDLGGLLRDATAQAEPETKSDVQ